MGKCGIHGEELRRDAVEVRRGMPPAPPVDYFKAQEQLFPHANSWVIGGCVVSDDDEDNEMVEYCSKCRSAEQAWLSGRPVDEFWIP